MSEHEPLKIYRKAKTASSKSLGYTFGVLFLCVGLWPWIRYGHVVNMWLCFVSLTLFYLAIFSPKSLESANKLWFRLGVLLQSFVSPIVMGFLFFTVIAPVAVVLKLVRWDPLNLRRTDSDSYWILSSDRNREQSSMKNQY